MGRRALAVLTAAASAVALCGAAVLAPAAPASGADGRFFDPGNIISDANFSDYAALSVSGVQAVLEDKGERCSAGSPACLKDYAMTTGSRSAEAGLCDAYRGGSGQSAARIVVDVARVCHISPKVLLVLLEKEQGLVSADRPSTSAYRYATGWCVTDSGNCAATQTGLFNQLYMGARQFLRYERNPDDYGFHAGTTERIGYHPDAECGAASVYLQNQATANLYIYTPYLPNSAALKNLYGAGDSCSAYGNRNFWRIYSDWFGSPSGGGNLVTADGTSSVFVVSGNRKYRVGAVPALTELSRLGSVTRISKPFLDSIPLAGNFTAAVKDSGTNEYFLLDRGKRLPLTGCSEAQDFRFSCSAAPALTSGQLAAFPSGAALTPTVRTVSGQDWAINGGARTQYLDAASAAAGGLSIGAVSTLADGTIAHLPVRAPVLPAGRAVTAGPGQPVLFPAAGRWQAADSTLHAQSVLASLFPAPALLDPKSVAALKAAPFDGLMRESGSHAAYVLTSSGLAPLAAPALGDAPARTVPAALIRSFPAAAPIAERSFVRATTSAKLKLLAGGLRRPVADTRVRAGVALAIGVPQTTRTLPDAVLAAIPAGPALLAPGAVVAEAGRLWLIDGVDRRWRLPADRARQLAGSPSPAPVGALAGYADTGRDASMGMHCGSGYFVQSAGLLHPIRKADAQAYKPAFAFSSYSIATCAGLAPSGERIGRLIRTPDGVVSLVSDGTRRVLSRSEAKALAETHGAPADVSAYYAKVLPLG